ncbi:MAG: methylase [Pedosphaera sp.]|nr:methylase [Pedosphaera sp.]
MPLSWNEIRHRAIAFSKSWTGESSEKGEKQTFWNEFFQVFGHDRRLVATFEAPVQSIKGTYGFIDLFWPENPTEKQKANVEAKAQAVLKAREQFPQATLADLYDPLAMPPLLAKAHTELDRAVDQCYRPQPFESDRHRVEFLFALYEQLTAPLVSMASKKPKRGKAVPGENRRTEF